MQQIKIIMISIIVLLGVACEDSSPLTDGNDLESTILSLISSDESVSLDGLSDEEVSNELFLEEDDDLARTDATDIYQLPVRWGRFVDSVEGSVTFESFEAGTDTIYALIEKVISGTFVVVNGDTATTDSGFVFMPSDTTEKPFQMTSQRRLRFVRVFQDENDPFLGWRIRGRTPVVITTESSNVNITGVTLEREVDINMFEPVFSLENTDDILNTFITLQDMPHLLNHEFIKTLAYVENSNPGINDYPASGEGVFMHYGKGHHRKARKPLFDDGGEVTINGHTSNDAVADDNEFTRIWRVHRRLPDYPVEIYQLFIDVIDYETMLNPEGEYHSVIIGFPYLLVN